MPQGERTPAETVRFKRMLHNVNLLYLGCSVLALIDISYLSRFWVRAARASLQRAHHVRRTLSHHAPSTRRRRSSRHG